MIENKPKHLEFKLLKISNKECKLLDQDCQKCPDLNKCSINTNQIKTSEVISELMPYSIRAGRKRVNNLSSEGKRFIYIIKTKDVEPPRIKIGETDNNDDKRIKSIESTLPYYIEVLIVFDSEEIGITEQQLHSKFDRYFVKNEWFEYNKSVENEINKIILMVKDLEKINQFKTLIMKGWKEMKTIRHIPDDIDHFFNSFCMDNWSIDIKNALLKEMR